MTLNENTILELLDQATPGPWEYKLEDGHIMSDLVEVLNGWIQTEDGETVLGTGLEINDEQELRNLALAALAPELAADWLRMRDHLDPVELTTEADFETAPKGTVVANPTGNAYQKVYADYWESFDDELKTEEMAAKGPWKILRWGWGEQQ